MEKRGEKERKKEERRERRRGWKGRAMNHKLMNCEQQHEATEQPLGSFNFRASMHV